MSISSNPPPPAEGNLKSSQSQNAQDPSNSPDALTLHQQADQNNNVSAPSVHLPLPHYDWENKWLKGDEYAFMLQNIDRYCAQFDLRKFERKTHPETIYRSPQNGLIYFVEGNCVGSEFGFPRVPFRKQYRWKKMNFTTDLPKKRPQVTYIVASSVRCSKHGNNNAVGDHKNNPSANEAKDVFRMHAVILYKSKETKEQIAQEEDNQEISLRQPQHLQQQQQPQQYILCHIRRIDTSEAERSSLAVGGSSSNEMSAEIDQIKFEQSEDEDNYNNLNVESNKSMNTKRRSISLNPQAKNEQLPSKTSKTKSKDHLKLQLKQQQQLQSTLISSSNPPETTNCSGNILHSGGTFSQGNIPAITQSNCIQGFRKLSECSGKNGCQAHESPTLLLQACHVSKPTNDDNNIRIIPNRAEQLPNYHPLHPQLLLQAHSTSNHRKGSSNSSSISNPQQSQYTNLSLHTKQSQQQEHYHQQQQLSEQQQLLQKQQQLISTPFLNQFNTFYSPSTSLDAINDKQSRNSIPINNDNLNNLPGLSRSVFALGSPPPPAPPSLPLMQFPQQTQSPLSGLQIQLMLLLAQQQQQAQIQQQQQQQLQQEQHYQQQLLQLQQSMPNAPQKNLFNLLTLWQQNPQFGDELYNFLQRQLPGQEIDYHNLFSLSHSPNPPATLISTQSAGLINHPSQQQINSNNNQNNSGDASLLNGELVDTGNLSINNNNGSSISSAHNNQNNPQ